MKRSLTFFPIFFICLFLALSIFFLSQKGNLQGVGMVFQVLFSPVQKMAQGAKNVIPTSSNLEKLKNQNRQLTTQLAQLELLKADNKALRDQFQTTTPKSIDLMPVSIVSMPEFIPGISSPETCIIHAGNNDGIHVGSALVINSNIIGVVVKENNHFAQIQLTTNAKTSITAKTATTQATGILKGEGNGRMMLDNVLLSDTLTVGDIVVTYGSQSLNGEGIPPGLIFGKITSIEKNPSNLFQKANVESLVDVSKLTMAFVLK